MRHIAAFIVIVIVLLGAGFGALRQFRPKAIQNRPLFNSSIPARDPRADPQLIDLTDHYNVALGETWQDPWPHDNDLSELSVEIGVFGHVSFDVRGLIQVEQQSQRYPPSADGIAVRQLCQRLHFLHAAANAALLPDGTEIGRYTVRYADGDKREIPIVLGTEHVDRVDRFFSPPPWSVSVSRGAHRRVNANEVTRGAVFLWKRK